MSHPCFIRYRCWGELRERFWRLFPGPSAFHRMVSVSPLSDVIRTPQKITCSLPAPMVRTCRNSPHVSTLTSFSECPELHGLLMEKPLPVQSEASVAVITGLLT